MEHTRGITTLFLISFLVLHLAISSSVRADEKDDDEYWRLRETQAIKASKEAYVLDPFEVTSSFNAAVHKGSDKDSTKTSRRSLMEAEGEVTPANNADAGTDRKHGSKHP